MLMDEPFGAVDPLTRDKLQLEFLQLQQDVRKTILFVTHDMDEAVRLGDRIAVFAQGGHLEQYDTPASVLGNPATPFVAISSGPTADCSGSRSPRSTRQIWSTRLSCISRTRWLRQVSRYGALALAGRSCSMTTPNLHGWIGVDMCGGSGTVGNAARRMEAWVPADASLRMAFGEMLQHDAGWVAVLEHGTRFLGVLTPQTLHEALRRSIDADRHDVDLSEITVDTVARA